MTPLHPQLRSVIEQFETATTRVRGYGGLPEARVLARPADGQWSAAECVQHLTVTTHAFLPRLDEALIRLESRPVDPSRRYRRDVIGWLLAWALEPPVRTRTKTPGSFAPPPTLTLAGTVTEFLTAQTALVERIARGDGRALDRLRIVSPFDARVRYTVWSAFLVMAAHQRRHLWQADRALAVVTA